MRFPRLVIHSFFGSLSSATHLFISDIPRFTMSYDDNELMRRFQALRGIVSNPIPSATSSSIPISSTREQSSSQQRPKKTKKQKSRGNRQLQRYRAKLRKQGFNDQTIATLIKDYHNPPSTLEHTKQRADVVAPTTSNIHVATHVSNQVESILIRR